MFADKLKSMEKEELIRFIKYIENLPPRRVKHNMVFNALDEALTLAITEEFNKETALEGLSKIQQKTIMSGALKFEGTQEEREKIQKIAKVYSIARVCHEANKAWCMLVGDYSQKHWDEAEEWQLESAIKGVEYRLANPSAGEDSQHNAWMEEKINNGWVYGETKDAELKTHPCIVPFDQLPTHQKKKDKLFCAIVDALK